MMGLRGGPGRRESGKKKQTGVRMLGLVSPRRNSQTVGVRYGARKWKRHIKDDNKDTHKDVLDVQFSSP